MSMEIEVGAILEGKVTSIKDYGAFVAFPNGKSGMIHISQVSAQFVQNIREKLTLDQTVRVKVLSIDEKGKIALSIKALEESEGVTLQKRPARKEEPSEPLDPTAPPPVYTAYVREKKAPKNGAEQAPKDPFEEMMSRFKTRSEEKICDLRRNIDNHRGGNSKKGSRKF